MTAMPRECVVDASVGIKVILREPLSDLADALFALLDERPPARLHVPDLFFLECANILWKATWRSGYAPDRAREGLHDLRALPLLSAPVADLSERALSLALDHGISAYDACYVALAEQLGVPLVTADERLVAKMAGSAHDVRWLGQITLTPGPSPATGEGSLPR